MHKGSETKLRNSAIDRLILLNVLSAWRPTGVTVVQKIMFLAELKLSHHHIRAPGYDFYRYTYGPFSKTLAADISELRASGLMYPTVPNLTARGKSLALALWGEVPTTPTNEQISGTLQYYIKRHGRKTALKLENIVYDIKMRPLNLFVDEPKQAIRKIRQYADLIKPRLEPDARGLDVDDDTLEKLMYISSLRPEDIKEMEEEAPPEAYEYLARALA